MGRAWSSEQTDTVLAKHPTVSTVPEKSRSQYIRLSAAREDLASQQMTITGWFKRTNTALVCALFGVSVVAVILCSAVLAVRAGGRKDRDATRNNLSLSITTLAAAEAAETEMKADRERAKQEASAARESIARADAAEAQSEASRLMFQSRIARLDDERSITYAEQKHAKETNDKLRTDLAKVQGQLAGLREKMSPGEDLEMARDIESRAKMFNAHVR